MNIFKRLKKNCLELILSLPKLYILDIILVLRTLCSETSNKIIIELNLLL